MKQKEPELKLTPEEERVLRGCTFSAGTALLFVLVIVLTFLLHSCKTVEYIKVPEVHTDTCYVDRIQRDSIRIETVKHDSIRIREKGDTVTIERWHTEWRDRYRDRYIHDSVYIAQHDTISIPYEVVKEVPAQINGWQRFRMQLGGLLLLTIVGYLAYLLWKFRASWMDFIKRIIGKL
jgi:uncharacterized protein YqhQ